MHTFLSNIYFPPTYTQKICLSSFRSMQFLYVTKGNRKKNNYIQLCQQVNVFNCVFFSSTTRNRARLLDMEYCLIPALSPTGDSKDFVARKHRAKCSTTGTEWARLLSMELSTSLIAPRSLYYMFIYSHLCSLCLFSLYFHSYMMHFTALLGVF